jgi:hypothetical protein
MDKNSLPSIPPTAQKLPASAQKNAACPTSRKMMYYAKGLSQNAPKRILD